MQILTLVLILIFIILPIPLLVSLLVLAWFLFFPIFLLLFVFISDVWLDQVAVTDNLRKLFGGFNSLPPSVFVLCGNFLSGVGESKYAMKLREHLKMLGELISEFEQIASHSTFLFVPGPADPGSPNIFPRPPLPSHLTQDITKTVKK